MKEDINLLPPAAKRLRVKGLYFKRLGRLLRVLIVLLILSVVSVTSLWAVNWMTNQSIQTLLVSGDDKELEVEEEVIKVNEYLAVFDRELKSREPVMPLVIGLLQDVPVGVKLSVLEYKGSDNLLQIEGVVVSTEVLVNFQKSLEILDWVKSVEAPLQNFATEADGKFSFVLILDE